MVDVVVEGPHEACQGSGDPNQRLLLILMVLSMLLMVKMRGATRGLGRHSTAHPGNVGRSCWRLLLLAVLLVLLRVLWGLPRQRSVAATGGAQPRPAVVLVQSEAFDGTT